MRKQILSMTLALGMAATMLPAASAGFTFDPNATCICTYQCSDGHITNGACPVCAASRTDLSLCRGTKDASELFQNIGPEIGAPERPDVEEWEPEPEIDYSIPVFIGPIDDEPMELLPEPAPKPPVVEPEQPVVGPEQPAVKPVQPVATPDIPVVEPEQPVIKPAQPTTPAEDAAEKQTKQIYNTLLPFFQDVANGKRTDATISFTVYHADKATLGSSIYDAVQRLNRDHPDALIWCMSPGNWSGTGTRAEIRYEGENAFVSNYNFVVRKEYAPNGKTGSRVDAAKLRSKKKILANAQAVVEANRGKSDYEKLIAYRRYIQENNRYNVVAERTPEVYTAQNNYGPWDIYYVFDEDPDTNVVCEGYALAFQYLCRLSGIECLSISNSDPAINHAWNQVVLDGKYYHVDIVEGMDDPIHHAVPDNQDLLLGKIDVGPCEDSQYRTLDAALFSRLNRTGYLDRETGDMVWLSMQNASVEQTESPILSTGIRLEATGCYTENGVTYYRFHAGTKVKVAFDKTKGTLTGWSANRALSGVDFTKLGKRESFTFVLPKLASGGKELVITANVV